MTLFCLVSHLHLTPFLPPRSSQKSFSFLVFRLERSSSSKTVAEVALQLSSFLWMILITTSEPLEKEEGRVYSKCRHSIFVPLTQTYPCLLDDVGGLAHPVEQLILCYQQENISRVERRRSRLYQTCLNVPTSYRNGKKKCNSIAWWSDDPPCVIVSGD